MNEKIASIGQLGQLVKRFGVFVKTDEVRSMLPHKGVQQLLASNYRIKACASAMAAVFTQYASAVNPFANDPKEKQSARYPKGFTMTPLKGQAEIWEQALPGLKPRTDLEKYTVVPAGYDGYCLFPTLAAFARERGLTDPYGEGEDGGCYGELIEHVMSLIKATRAINNRRAGQLGPKQVWLDDRVRMILKELEKANPDEDFIVLPVNSGSAYAGRTPRFSCEEMLLADTLPLPALFVGCMLFTNPQRFESENDLWIDCCGDRYKTADGYVYCLYFGLDGGSVNFVHRVLGHAVGYCGSASASLSGVAGNL